MVIVIPPMKRQIKESAKKGLFEVMRLFEDVIRDTCPNIIASEMKDQIALLKRKHEINRGGATAFEFNVRVKNFPERITLAHRDLPDAVIDNMWGVGRVGINMELCGYSKRGSALILLRHFPYVEKYRRTEDL